jgi:16S rRNA (guanine966-N2)-methyltransferase
MHALPYIIVLASTTLMAFALAGYAWRRRPLVGADALAWLARSPDRAFDLVFLDPPFGAGLLAAAAQALASWLAPQAWVYVEHGAEAAFLPPPGWRLHREGGTREARHRLFRVERAGAGTLEDSPTEAGIQPP